MTNYFSRLGLLLLVALFWNSQLIAQDADTTTTAEEPTYYGGAAGKKLDWAMFYLRKHYVDSTNNDRLAEIALRSILKELDPFSFYQTKEALEKQQKADEGIQEEGIGVSLYPLAGKAMIIDIVKGGAADEVGLKKGDFIVAVNGQSVVGARMDTIANRIKGPEETTVTLTYERNNSTTDLTIERAAVPLHSVDAYHLLPNNVGYIKIGRFNFLTVPEFQEALQALKNKGIKDLVLDLRGNLGGVVDASVGLADEFLKGKKLVIFTHSHNSEREEYYTEKEGGFEEGRLVILMNQYTASASEIFTAAMQDWDRALVIGQSSYGKGLIQQSYLLGDGSGMRITIGRYYTAAGRNIQNPHYKNTEWLTPYLKDLPANGYTTALPIPENKRYNTRNGRKLFTNQGGITPDIYIAPKGDAYYNQLNNAGLLFRFAMTYANLHRSDLQSRFTSGTAYEADVAVNQEISDAFLDYAQTEINTRGYAIQLQPIVPKKMLNSLKGWIGAQVWDNNTYYGVFNQTDPVIIRALESLEDGAFKDFGLE